MMAIVGLVLAVVLGVAGAAFLTHVGAGGLVDETFGMLRSGVDVVESWLRRQYFDRIIPLAQSARYVTAGLLGVAVLTSFVSLIWGPMPWWGFWLLVLPAAIGWGFLLFFQNFSRINWTSQQSGKTTIPANMEGVRLNFNAVNEAPLIRVTPFVRGQEFEIDELTDSSFVIYQPPRPVAIPGAPPPVVPPVPTVPRVFNWSVREAPTSPVTNVVLISLGALVTMAILFVVIGLSASNADDLGRAELVYMAIPFGVVALALVSASWQFINWTASKIGDGVEGVANGPFAVVMSLAKRNSQPLEQFVERMRTGATQNVDVINQRALEANRLWGMARISLICVEVITLAMLFPSWTAFWVFRVIEFAGASVIMALDYLSKVFVKKAEETGDVKHLADAQQARDRWAGTLKRGTYLYAALVVSGIIVLVLSLLPGVGPHIAKLKTALVTVVVTTLDSSADLLVTAVGWIVLTILAFGILMGVKLVTKNGFFRLVAGAPFIVLVAVGLYGLAAVLGTERVSHAYSEVRAQYVYPHSTPFAMAIDEVLPPPAPVASGTTPPPAALPRKFVRIGFTEIPEAEEYRIERALTTDQVFTTLKDTKGSDATLAKGRQLWTDETVQPGQTYVYRVVQVFASSPSGASTGIAREVPNRELTVFVPYPTQPKPPASAAPPPGKPGKTAGCANCGRNTGLKSYCTRHPNADICMP